MAEAKEAGKGAPQEETEVLYPFGSQVEFVCEGTAGGNFNNEQVKVVFTSDKPVLVGNVIRTIRVQVATATMRKAALRRIIAQLTEFADNIDNAIAGRAAKTSASASPASDE